MLAESVERQFSVFYSTSHISDLMVGDDGSEKHRDLIYSDLEYIYNLTNGNCAYIEFGEIKVSERSPITLYQEKISERNEFDTDDLCALLRRDVTPGTIEHDVLNTWLNSPMPIQIRLALSNPKSADAYKKHLPQISLNSNMSDLINQGWKQYRMLMATDAYKNIRGDLQTSLKLKPNQFVTKEPFKAINDIYKKLFEEITPLLKANDNASEHAPQWFSDITDNYLVLDIHGYSQDKIKVDAKNNDTMRNTIDDGFHATFASMFDCYITNDERTINKTKAVYTKFGIQTKVFTPQEFEAYYANSLIIPRHASWRERTMTLLRTLFIKIRGKSSSQS